MNTKTQKVSCPNSTTEIWNMHPRIFLDIDDEGVAKCSYCGTEYHITKEKIRSNFQK